MDSLCLNPPLNFRDSPFYGQSLLPPKCPTPTIPLSSSLQPSAVQAQIPRSSSASVLAEEQPAWLEDLLNEPETPTAVNGGHRRASSDPFAYTDANTWTRDDWLRTIQKPPSQNAESSSVGSNGSHAKPPTGSPPSKTEPKRAKQHNGRRSRVRKLQYIAELERNVQILQAEGSGVSAELEFLDQQNLVLSMENRALKQRLESLSQVHLIKTMEQEILERELVRLQYLHHQQNLQLHHHHRHQQHRNPIHRRVRSCDIESQFDHLSLKSMEPGPSTVSLQR